MKYICKSRPLGRNCGCSGGSHDPKQPTPHPRLLNDSFVKTWIDTPCRWIQARPWVYGGEERRVSPMLLPTMRFGETRSGKPIFTYFTEDISAISSEVSTFTAADSFDAHALFEHLIRRELRKHGKDASQLETFRNRSEVHTLFFMDGRVSRLSQP